ncbi:unnamed protein product [Polarella glacialis]|uniref:BUB1 N-terminal domain-containing protein n=1 Tax=Polarella glacialis TaxID=89957 RepID=A0A813KJM7_POLGL|nr:unnamed protein product [Polarella glacialis]CAE8700758.1 unnamed protein product [Polarella glacialis]
MAGWNYGSLPQARWEPDANQFGKENTKPLRVPDLLQSRKGEGGAISGAVRPSQARPVYEGPVPPPAVSVYEGPVPPPVVGPPPAVAREGPFAAAKDFEAALASTGSGRGDVVQLWTDYVQITLITRAEREALIARACHSLSADPRHHQDWRLLRLWVKFAEAQQQPASVFASLEARNIGTSHALLYEAWSSSLEIRRQFEEAAEVYRRGLACGAQPQDRLRARRAEFDERMRQRAARIAKEGLKRTAGCPTTSRAGLQPHQQPQQRQQQPEQTRQLQQPQQPQQQREQKPGQRDPSSQTHNRLQSSAPVAATHWAQPLQPAMDDGEAQAAQRHQRQQRQQQLQLQSHQQQQQIGTAGHNRAGAFRLASANAVMEAPRPVRVHFEASHAAASDHKPVASTSLPRDKWSFPSQGDPTAPAKWAAQTAAQAATAAQSAAATAQAKWAVQTAAQAAADTAAAASASAPGGTVPAAAFAPLAAGIPAATVAAIIAPRSGEVAFVHPPTGSRQRLTCRKQVGRAAEQPSQDTTPLEPVSRKRPLETDVFEDAGADVFEDAREHANDECMSGMDVDASSCTPANASAAGQVEQAVAGTDQDKTGAPASKRRRFGGWFTPLTGLFGSRKPLASQAVVEPATEEEEEVDEVAAAATAAIAKAAAARAARAAEVEEEKERALSFGLEAMGEMLLEERELEASRQTAALAPKPADVPAATVSKAGGMFSSWLPFAGWKR